MFLHLDCQVSAHFGTKLYEACKHLDTEGEGSITTGQLRKLFFGDYTAPEGSDNKVGVVMRSRVNKRIYYWKQMPTSETYTAAPARPSGMCRAREKRLQLSGYQFAILLKRLRASRHAFQLVQPYEEVADLQQLQGRMVQSLGDYNARSRKPMDLVMFMFAVEHVSRLAR